MPDLTHKQAIKEFYGIVKDKYPNLTFDQFTDICESPFRAARAWIADGTLPFIRWKHIGQFRVFPIKIERYKAKMEKKFLEDEITHEEFRNKMVFFRKYLIALANETENRKELHRCYAKEKALNGHNTLHNRESKT